MEKISTTAKTIFSLTIIALTYVVAYLLGYAHKEYELDCYENYYENAENLLNVLELQHNWVDCIDHYGYYESLEQVNNIRLLK